MKDFLRHVADVTAERREVDYDKAFNWVLAVRNSARHQRKVSPCLVKVEDNETDKGARCRQ